IEFDAAAAPVRAGEVNEQKFVTVLRFVLGLFEIGFPFGLRLAGSRKGEGKKRKQGEKNAVIFHIRNFGEREGGCKWGGIEPPKPHQQKSPALERRALKLLVRGSENYLMWPETSLVISNMLTW